MSRIRIVESNLIDSMTLGASPAMTGALGVDNLKDSRRSFVARSTTLTGQEIWAESATGGWVSCIALWRHNLSDGALWRARCWDTQSRSGLPVYDSGYVDVSERTVLGDLAWGTSPLGESVYTGWDSSRVCCLWIDAVFARSIQVTLVDPSNSDGHIDICRWWAGLHWTPSANPDYGAQISWVDPGQQVRTSGSTLRATRGEMYRDITLTWSYLSDQDRGRLNDFCRRAGLGGEFLISVFPGAGGKLERDYTFIGKLTGPHASIARSHGLWGDRLTIQES